MNEPTIYRFATNIIDLDKYGQGDQLNVEEFVLATEFYSLRGEIETLRRKAMMFDELTPTLVQLGIIT